MMMMGRWWCLIDIVYDVTMWSWPKSQIYRRTYSLSPLHNHLFSSNPDKVGSNDQLIDSICFLRADVDRVLNIFMHFDRRPLFVICRTIYFCTFYFYIGTLETICAATLLYPNGVSAFKGRGCAVYICKLLPIAFINPDVPRPPCRCCWDSVVTWYFVWTRSALFCKQPQLSSKKRRSQYAFKAKKCLKLLSSRWYRW